jgi:hypothetical protein
MTHRTPRSAFVARLVEYAAADDDAEFVIPEDLSTLSDEDLTQLHEQAVGHFDQLFNDGQNLSDQDLAALSTLTEGIETLVAELDRRAAMATERAEAAAALAARAHPESQDAIPDGEEATPLEGVEPAGNAGAGPDAPPPPEGGATEDAEGTPASTVASAARREIRVNLGSLRSRQSTAGLPRPADQAQTMRDLVLASGEGSGYAQGVGLDWHDVGRVVDRRLTGFNQAQYQSANRSGTHLRQQFGVATIRKPFTEDLIVQSNDPAHVDQVLRHAMDEHRLPGGSLVAAGGWCAPSEIIYDLCELESRDGLFSVPEIGVARGGIQWTLGPDFSDIYNNTGFCYTEQDAIDGDWDGAGGGAKPCYEVECPDFQEARLGLCGLCISAGLLQQRGYPEVIARTVRGALVAHDHKMSAQIINAIVAGSTPVTMTAGTAGTLAPLLTSIELQVEHYKYTNRMSRSTTLEAVFPYWIRGAIRSDLALRGGVDLLDVTDAQVDAWFRSRGVSVQYVYDWQDLNAVAAGAFVQWPATVKFLLYAAGTWVKGGSDVITLDTIYDSVLLGQNQFTALFTEEGWLVAKLCGDSRVITAPVCADGATAAGVVISCTGVAS